MTDDRLSGSAKNIGGQVEEGFGRVIGDEKTELQGKAKQVISAAPEATDQEADAERNGGGREGALLDRHA